MTTAHTLEKLDATLDTVEELLRELPLSMRDEAKCIDMLYVMYVMAERATLEVDKQSA